MAMGLRTALLSESRGVVGPGADDGRRAGRAGAASLFLPLATADMPPLEAAARRRSAGVRAAAVCKDSSCVPCPTVHPSPFTKHLFFLESKRAKNVLLKKTAILPPSQFYCTFRVQILSRIKRSHRPAQLTCRTGTHAARTRAGTVSIFY